jgi:hypothetical protein
MRGNVSTVERSSIGKSLIIGEIASPPKPRKELKRPPRNAGAGRHRSSSVALVGFDDARTEVLGCVPGKHCPWTPSPGPYSTINQRISQAFLSCPVPSRFAPNRLFAWQCECLRVASSARPGIHSPRFICEWSTFRIRNGSGAIHSGKVRPPVSQRAAAFGSLSFTEDQASSRSGGNDPQ